MLNRNILVTRNLLVSVVLLLLCSFIKRTTAVPVTSERFFSEGSVNATRLAKRFDGGRFSFYDAGLGACGEVNSNSDFIVALNIAQWDNRAHCGQTITISYGGKTATAKIMDLCPGCPYGGLDLTRGLFSYFASQDLGIIHGTWNFGSGGGGTAPRPTTTTTRRTTSTPSPTRRPSTTRTQSTTSTRTSTRALVRPTSTHSTSTISLHTSATTSTLRSSSNDALAQATPSPASAASSEEVRPDALQQLEFILLRLGAMLIRFARENEQPKTS